MATAYLTRRTTFSAAHRLHSPLLSDAENLRVFHKCNNPNGHGHNYELFVTIRGPVDTRTGMIMNLVDLKAAIDDAILRHVDHQHLNQGVPMFQDVNPTVEMMTVVFWKALQKSLPQGLLHEVRLLETENNSAVYRGE